jgi:hypothetical protein
MFELTTNCRPHNNTTSTGMKGTTRQSLLSNLPPELIGYIMIFMNYMDLSQFEQTCEWVYRLVASTHAWKYRCDMDFAPYSRYDCRKYGYPYENYKKSYRHLFLEVRRNKIQNQDLESLDWYFNYTPIAGGRGKDTLVSCSFRNGQLHLVGYSPLPYYISLDGSLLGIGIFPPHQVNRLPNGEWLIINENVTFVSCEPNGVLTYSDRGFQ